MDFVAWCDLVLRKVIEAASTSSSVRSIGVDEYQLARTIFGQFAMQPGFHGSKQHEGMHDALRSLQQVFLIKSSESGSLWKATKLGRDLASENDMTPLWQGICQEKLGREHQQLLRAVNKLSPHDAGDHMWLEEIAHQALLAELGWAEGMEELWPVSQELEELDLSPVGELLDQISDATLPTVVSFGKHGEALLSSRDLSTILSPSGRQQALISNKSYISIRQMRKLNLSKMF